MYYITVRPILIFAVLLIINPSKCARILGSVFTPSYSHQIAFQPIWRELSLKGHQVTVLTTNPINDPALTNLTEIDMSISYEIMKSFNTDEALTTKETSAYQRAKTYMQALNATADKQFSLPEVQKLLNNHSEKFDLLMLEVIYPTHMALAWRFDAPFIGLVSLDALPRLHAAIGNPIHPVLYPDVNLPFDKNLTFVERLMSTLFLCFMLLYGDYRLYPSQDLTAKKYFGDGVPPLKDIQSNMSMLFINANPLFQNVRPLVPTTVQIGGGIHLQDPKPLSKDIARFLDEAKDGFVYFSLGTNVKSAALDSGIKAAIIEAFAELPFKVLWKFEENLENLPENVKIVKWAPQTSILAHPNIKLFITQCGLQSMEEAIYYNVPMVGLPFYGDQRNNGKILKSKGLGLTLEPEKLNKKDLLDAILEVSQNPRFKETLKEISELLQDEQISGLEKAVWWAEYVIRHKGTAHLRCPVVDLPLYQYLLLDVIGFLLLILFSTIYVSKKLLSLIPKLIFRVTRKQKRD